MENRAGRGVRALKVAVPAALAGVLLTYAFPTAGLWWISWLAPSVLYLLLSRPGDSVSAARRGALAGFSFGLALFLVGLHWMTELATPLWVTLSIIQATFFVLFAAPTAATLVRLPLWSRPIAFAAAWTLFEWVRGLGLYAFPWFNLSSAHATDSALPWLQIAAFSGQWGLSFSAALGGALLVEGRRSKRPALGIAALGVFFGVYGIGRAMLSGAAAGDGAPVKVAMAQGAESRESGGGGDDVWGIYTDLTARAVSESVDLVLWPEGTVVGDLSGQARLSGIAREADVPLLAGAGRMGEDGRPRNVLFLYDRTGDQTGFYLKRKLVPFGEIYPWRASLPTVYRSFGVGHDSYVSGDTAGVLDLPGGHGKMGALICYESAFPFLSRDCVQQGATTLAFLTSDQTFGRTAELPQHLQLAIVRAVETRRWVARATSTGISAAISPGGHVLSALGPGKRGVAIATIHERTDISLATRFGEWWIVVCAALAISSVVYARFGKRIADNEEGNKA